MSETHAPTVHLDFAMQHRIGSLSLDVAFQLTHPWSLLFAPSGAGKTTVLRVIAGLLRPQYARIMSRNTGEANSGEFLLTDTNARVFILPHRRNVRMVGQDTPLFSHLSVLENVRYGTMQHALDRGETEGAAKHLQSVLALCRAEHLTAKMPSQLSGGERQRVALARSLAAPGCNLLLLDEPFTGLDVSLRDELIADLRVWLTRRNIPVLSVTHDVAEAFQLSAEVLKLQDGRITVQGEASVVLAREREQLFAALGGAPCGLEPGNADPLRE